MSKELDIMKSELIKGLNEEIVILKELVENKNSIITILNQQLQLGGVVGRSEQLPTKEDFISELEQHQEKYKLAHTEEVNNAYTLGFRHCFNFINDRVKLK